MPIQTNLKQIVIFHTQQLFLHGFVFCLIKYFSTSVNILQYVLLQLRQQKPWLKGVVLVFKRDYCGPGERG